MPNNIGAFGENFPYTNFHNLNMDWIIKIFKQVKDLLDEGYVKSINGENGEVTIQADWINDLKINNVYSTTENVSEYTQETLANLFNNGYRVILQENNLHTFDQIYFMSKTGNNITIIQYDPFSQTSGVRTINGQSGHITIDAENLKMDYEDANSQSIYNAILGINDISVWIGDSYVQANSLGELQSQRFSSKISSALGTIEKNYAIGGSGYLAPVESTFKDQLNNAIADLTTSEKKRVKYVFLAGGRNDPWLVSDYTIQQLNTAVTDCILLAKSAFPYAKIFAIPMLWDTSALPATYQTYLYDIMRCFYFNGSTVRTVSNAYTYLQGRHDLILEDHIHPSVNGHALIANRLLSSMDGVNENIPAFYSDTNNGLTIKLKRIGDDIQIDISGTPTNATAFGAELTSTQLIDVQLGLVTNGPSFITLTGRDGSSCVCQIFFNINYSQVKTVFSVQALGAMTQQSYSGTTHITNGV